jgi:hypothetical protein
MTAVPISSATTTANSAEQGWTWSRFLGFLAGIVIALAILEVAAHLALTPPARLREVNDGIASFDREDPTVLVIGSSHARTFDSVGAHLRALTNGRERMVSIPLEYGKFTGYAWVVEHRLRPLIEGRGDGSSLGRALIVTEWWDSCPVGDAPQLNLPARAWTFRDFVADVTHQGLTPFNRAYLSARWADGLSAVSLVQNRTRSWIPTAIREHWYPAATRDAYVAQMTDEWKAMVEGGARCIGSEEQMAALDSMLDYFARIGVQPTIVLYPRKPSTMTALARDKTFAAFLSLLSARMAPRGVPIVDLTEGSILGDDDFAIDIDHVTPEGNGKFAAWALAGPLQFLLTPAGAAQGATP